MTQSDTESLIAPLQVIQRIQTLGIDPATFDTPEANWKNLYNSVMTRLAPLATAETAQAVNFTGSSLAELNDFLVANPGSTVEVISPALVMDATLVVPTGTILHGNGAVLTPGNETLDKAIVLDQAENTAVTGFVCMSRIPAVSIWLTLTSAMFPSRAFALWGRTPALHWSITASMKTRMVPSS